MIALEFTIELGRKHYSEKNIQYWTDDIDETYWDANVKVWAFRFYCLFIRVLITKRKEHSE